MRIPTLFAMAILALGLVAPGLAWARPGWVTGTFVYANLCTDDDGALAGRRVVVRRSPNGSDVTFQAASGAPLPVETLTIDDERGEISFTVPDEAGPIRFQGTAAATVLAGTMVDRDGEHPLRLRRVLRSRQHEACRDIEPEPAATGSTN